MKDGGILLSVHTEDSAWVDRAKKILEATRAPVISSAAEATSDVAVGR